ncbi:PIN domain-containing protein [Bradyrhizobium sp. cf659]|uniref:PIN domain-containing protein n=1 Tax=Bradyrhizobium sp. cf659 TaxID=1761771 RepID=UPI0008E7ABD9|nr:PIN domain-containing protein [Bradyrhizobium sp. cf659]SFH91985.1 hypothetical protein SAMN04487925_1011127 [Bradyrhizobium sp. cf659]
MIVVCDTNVFVRETHLLRKKGGPQLIKLLHATKGKLFVPGALKTEYVEQTRIAAGEERSKASAAIGNFRTLVGSADGYPLLGDDAVDQRTLQRLLALETLVLSSPMTNDVLVAAGERSLQKKRPTSKSDHGYKDCLIWESVLRLPAGSRVYLISRDGRAFFDGDQLAQELVDEASARGLTISGYKELNQALQEMQADTPALDLAAVEAIELVEGGVESDLTGETSLSMSAAASVSGLTPLPMSQEATEPLTGGVERAHQELSTLLASAQKEFEGLDEKILGYIAYLGTPTKTELFNLLSQSSVPIEVARNVAERLAIAGIIRDTGNHYLPSDVSAADLAAETVETEIIKLLKEAP